MAITAEMVKNLRERTGAGMMECKTALTESNGDVDAAIEYLRKRGMAQAAKRAGRVASEGIVGIRINDDRTLGVLAEVNCETDFVARNDGFKALVEEVTTIVFNSDRPHAELVAVDGPIGSRITAEIARVGENMAVPRTAKLTADYVGSYSHMGGKIGVLVQVDGAQRRGDQPRRIQGLRDRAGDARGRGGAGVHDARRSAGRAVEKEKEIYRAQMAESGKPANVIEKIIEGKLGAFYERRLPRRPADDPRPEGQGDAGARRRVEGHRQPARHQGLRTLQGRRGQPGVGNTGAGTRIQARAQVRLQPAACRLRVVSDGGPGTSPPPFVVLAGIISPGMSRPAYTRVLLKLSGEALMGDQGYGVDPAVVTRIAEDVAEIRALGVQVAIVIGGGNIFRGMAGSARGMDRATADYMGMLATVMNGLALQDGTRAPRRADARPHRHRDASRWPSRSSAAAPSATSRRGASSCSPPAPATPTSPPTRPPPCARWKSRPTSS